MVQLDFIVMVVFAILIFAIGLVFTKMSSKSGQAFFEAGGETPWWINGLSLFISYFSAGTFVVWGSIAYKFGLVANAIQLTMAISGGIVAYFIAKRWKRTGVKTAAEYIGRRFGSNAQQFYTYLILILSLFTTASVLYPVGKMVYIATPFSLNTCIMIIGVIIILRTAAGGLWAVLATDVVQFVILTASVLIVLPISLTTVGGMHNFVQHAPVGFFKPFNNDYTFGFMLAFIVYQTMYIGGNWSYVQRYTSVKDEKNAQKVAYIFTILYLVSPILWMLPPMIYRVINPNLQGLEAEGAYMMLCQKILPAGLVGLVFAGMISATSSKANATINLAATVFANDLYKNLIRPKAKSKELILMARLFTLLFGTATVGIAMLVPLVGGIVDFVLKIASIAGGALFAPIIWSLFSKRQTTFSTVTSTVIALIVNLWFEMLMPIFIHVKLSRTMETVLGQAIPLLVLAGFEMYYRSKGMININANAFDKTEETERIVLSKEHHQAAEEQNIFGIQVIGISMAIVSLGIVIIGSMAKLYGNVVIVVGIVIFLVSIFVWLAARKRKKIVNNYRDSR